ncbi:response regulator transcription factor [Carboxydothermus hydrogenoformans]|uniref:Stage 0 sporulation protein A homolog n=1 Tax=Carboxydothermus hydrogenoformans (strain ATCC BAA-161 / DSM 6008 / Z-2901) TaxID=246194 RepID=Q3A924_CARHZ|nr:response regulator transcription factor [Carboxydothermus hydrogenoformans]ABB14356.1 DNA-binding response regulator [Carboxydothermus hydrogenoformans Z-2901]
MARKILIVDDEPKIVTMVKSYLLKEGYEVITAFNGREALNSFYKEKPDLIVLDWMMPEMSGIEVLREIRKKSQIPIIMLTAKTEEVDKLIGFEFGVDDYVVKPFSLRELSARIKTILKRLEAKTINEEIVLTEGDLTLYPHKREVFLKGKPLDLTPTEFKLLEAFLKNPGKAYSRLELLEYAIGEAYEGYERTIDTHISNLRKKIEKDPANPEYIQTVFGIGYKLKPRGEKDENHG